MVVCVCKGVSDKTIRWHVQNGATTLREVMAACRAGTDCGTCACALKELIETTRAECAGATDTLPEAANGSSNT